MIEARRSAESQVADRLNKDQYGQSARDNIFSKTEDYQRQQALVDEYDSIESPVMKGINPESKKVEEYKLTDDEVKVFKPEAPKAQDNYATNPYASRQIAKQVKAQRDLADLEQERRTANLKHIDDVSQNAGQYVSDRNSDIETDSVHIDALESGAEKNRLMEEIAQEIQKKQNLLDSQRAALLDLNNIEDKDVRLQKQADVERQIMRYEGEINTLEDQRVQAENEAFNNYGQDIRNSFDERERELNETIDKTSESVAKMNDKEMRRKEDIENMRLLVTDLISRAKRKDD